MFLPWGFPCLDVLQAPTSTVPDILATRRPRPEDKKIYVIIALAVIFIAQ